MVEITEEVEIPFFFFETGSHYVTQVGLELKILLSLPSE
jgi:hypothetical protein